MNKTIKRTVNKGLLLLSTGLFLVGGAACGKDQDYYDPETITATDGNTAGQPDLRNDPSLLDIIANSKGQGKYQADAHWQQQFTNSKVSVNIDADVIVPDVDKYPVTKVSDLELTQQDADKAFEYLSQGKELLGDSGIDASQPEQLEDPAAEDGVAPPTGVEETLEPNQTEQGQPITKFSDTEETTQLVAYVDLGRPSRDRIMVQNYEENYFQHAQISFGAADPTTSSILDDNLLAPGAAMDSQPQGVQMSKADAEAKAKEAAQALGLQLEVASVRRGYGYMWEENQEEGWVVRMRRNVEGVPTAPTASSSVLINVNSTNAETYGLQQLFAETTDSPDATPMQSVRVSGYDYEEMLVCLDDSGIIYLDWKGSVQLGDVENDNVKLMAFEELKQAVTAGSGNMNIFQWLNLETDDTYNKVTVNIDEMKLGLMRIPMEGDPKSGRLIPVWTLSGSYTPEYNKEKTIAHLGEQQLEDGETAEDIWNEYFSPEAIANARQSYGVQLVINALDGNVIPTVL